MKNLPVKKKKMGYYTYWELDRTIQNSVPFDGFFGRDKSKELFQNVNETGGSSINNISPILAKMSYIHQINQEIKLHLLRQK